MAGDEAREPQRARVNRARVVRTLTFWLRPEFVLRIVSRFQKVAGFDRAIALASGALTATIPLTIVTSAVASQLEGKGTAERIIDRYELTGGEHDPRHRRVPLPHGRRPELHPRRAAAVRADLEGRPGVIHVSLGRSRLELSAALLAAPLSAVFLVWSSRMLSAKRIARRDLIPFGILGSVLLAACSVAATVYVPHLFTTYATRYGVIGAVFAMISAFFCVMVVLVGSAAAGREVDEELGRIRRGEKPAEDEGPAPVGRGHSRGTSPLGDAPGAGPGAAPKTPRGLTGRVFHPAWVMRCAIARSYGWSDRP